MNWKFLLKTYSLTIFTVILIAIAWGLTHSGFYKSSVEKRVRLAKSLEGDIIIGTVWPNYEQNGLLMEGLRLALEEINQKKITIKTSDGRLLKKQIRIIHKIENTSEDARKASEELAQDNRVVAVIGHGSSSNALSSMVTYENHGMLLVSPSATAPMLSKSNFKYLLRTIPTDREFSNFLLQQGAAEIEASLGIEVGRSGLFFNRSVYGTSFVRLFKNAVEDQNEKIKILGELNEAVEKKLLRRSMTLKKMLENEALTELGAAIKPIFGADAIVENHPIGIFLEKTALEYSDAQNFSVVFTGSYFSAEREFRSLISDMIKTRADVLVFADSAFRAKFVIKQLMAMGVKLPIIGSEPFDLPEFMKDKEVCALNIFAASIFDPNSTDPKIQNFVSKFVAKWNVKPDYTAAQGYEALHMLADAFEASNSIVPLEVITTIKHSGKTWPGLSGAYSFNDRGNIIGKEIEFRENECP